MKYYFFLHFQCFVHYKKYVSLANKHYIQKYCDLVKLLDVIIKHYLVLTFSTLQCPHCLQNKQVQAIMVRSTSQLNLET